MGAPREPLKRVHRGALEAVHGRLREIRVRLPRESSAPRLRALFRDVRDKRNLVATVLSHLLPTLGRLKADLARVERVIEAGGARILDLNEGMLGVKNAQQRVARVKVQLAEDLDRRASLAEDLALVGEAVSHARLVLEELRSAFEEGSRVLSTLDFEFKVETSNHTA